MAAGGASQHGCGQLRAEPVGRAVRCGLPRGGSGERLRKLHLMQTKAPAALEIEPNTSDNLEIGAIKYKNGVLHLNANKRILGIPENVWGYRIGGYQVLDKWFKSHKSEIMTADSFDHIANVAGLLAETIKIQEELIGLH